MAHRRGRHYSQNDCASHRFEFIWLKSDDVCPDCVRAGLCWTTVCATNIQRYKPYESRRTVLILVANVLWPVCVYHSVDCAVCLAGWAMPTKMPTIKVPAKLRRRQRPKMPSWSSCMQYRSELASGSRVPRVARIGWVGKRSVQRLNFVGDIALP